MKAVILEDEPISLSMLEDLCKRIPNLELERSFSDPAAAMRYLLNFPVDLLFLDIHLPGTTGIEFYKSLSPDIMVIFITAHSQYAVEGFELSAIDYLLKPITEDRFRKAVNKAQEYLQLRKGSGNTNARYIFLRSDYTLVKVELDHIRYIEGLSDYVRIHLEGQKPLLCLMSMKAILEKMPAQEFIRIHRSFIVPLKKVQSIRNRKLQLPDIELPIGNSFDKDVREKIKPGGI